MLHHIIILVHTLALVVICLAQSDNLCLSKDAQSDLFRRVSESAEKGDIIFTMSFYGTDDEVELKSGNNDYFAFEPATRNVIVNATLDAELDLQTQNLEVICKVKQNGLEIPHTVYISITDANDNTPTFTANIYNISIGEMTQINSRVSNDIRASDNDATPQFKSIYYSIIDGQYSDYFVLENSLSPNFILAKPLDYESLQTFSFHLMAQDYYPGSDPEVKFNSTCLVVITVEDQDDQYPIFNSSIYRGVITSLTTQDSIIDITPPISAYDPDVTLNARVEYSFHGDVYASSGTQAPNVQEADVGLQVSSDAAETGHYFDIDADTGDVTLVKRPTSNEIYLLLQATQEDNPSRYGVALLTIQVQGSNVNAPVFTKSDYQVVTQESFPTGEVLTSVLALDKDTGSRITYRLANSSNFFSVDPSSGNIRLQQKLSQASNPPYRIYIEASDGELTTVATVSIRVLSSNNQRPRITNSNLNVSATRDKDQVVIDINAEDPDGQNSLSFTLLNYKTIFAIDNNGVVRIIADPEDIVENDYQVTVLVSDGGQPSLDKAVAIRVQFPPRALPVVSAGSSDDMIPIVLGALVAVLLIVVIILVVFILRNRLKDKEHLDRVKKQHPSRDPRALAFKPKSFGRKAGTSLDHIEFHEDDLDGATTIQENPLSANSKGSYFNFGQLNSDTEGDLDMYNNSDIQVETSVVPFDRQHGNDDNNNDNIYNNSQFSVDSEDAANMDKTALSSFYRNGSLSTYPDSSGSDISLNTSPTDSNDSKKGLVSPSDPSEVKGIFWVNNKGGGAMPEAASPSHIEMNPDTSVQPAAQKQELTVYF